MVSADLPSNANNFTISGLAARTAYHVDVAARTQVGSGDSYLVAVETGVAPGEFIWISKRPVTQLPDSLLTSSDKSVWISERHLTWCRSL